MAGASDTLPDVWPPELLRDRDNRVTPVLDAIHNVIYKNQLMPEDERAQILALTYRLCEAWERINDYVMRSSLRRPHLSSPKRPKWPPSPPVKLERLHEIYELAYRITVQMLGTPLLYSQKIGDRKILAEHIRRGGHLSPEMGMYIAAIVDGVASARAPNRHKSAKNAKRNRTIIWFILRARANDVDDDPSIELAVEKFGLGRRSTQKIFAEGKDQEPALVSATQELLSKLGAVARDMESDCRIAKLGPLPPNFLGGDVV